MLKVKDLKNLKKLGVFAGGVLFGTAGIAVLASKDAKKLYTQCTAAVLRGKDSVMKTTVTSTRTRRISMKSAMRQRLQRVSRRQRPSSRSRRRLQIRRKRRK